MSLLLEEQTEGFLGAKLGNASEVLHTEAIKHFGSCKCTCAEAQRTFYVIWNKWLSRDTFLIHILSIQTASAFSLFLGKYLW